MRLIPVLDVMAGVTVRAIAGRRAEYRSLVSGLTPSTDPRVVAEVFRQYFGLIELYLADLDAIAGADPALPLYTELRDRGFRLWVDAGVRTAADAMRLIAAGVPVVVAGLETLHGPGQLQAAVAALGPDRVAFSLDMMGGQLLGHAAAWGDSPDAAADRAVAFGVRRIILLDLARVGVGSGTGTEPLLARLAERHPDVELVAGGGVRGVADVQALADAGAAAALVASALHDGRLPGPMPRKMPRAET